MRILVIEDDSDLRSLIVQVLTRSDVQIETAANCDQGRRRLRHKSFDIVCLDNHLPDGLGADIIEPILQANPGTRIIVISNAADDRAFRKRTLALGASAVLGKPFSVKELQALIKRLFEQSQKSPDEK